MSLDSNQNEKSLFNPSQYKTTPDFTLNKAWNEWSDYSLDNTTTTTDVHSPKNPETPKVRVLLKEEKRVNDNELLKTYIEKVDRDQSDLRNDIRASEERTGNRLDKIESRMDERLNRIEDMIAKTNDSVGSTRNWIAGICIATIVGIATMVVTVIVTT